VLAQGTRLLPSWTTEVLRSFPANKRRENVEILQEVAMGLTQFGGKTKLP
jgi:hypothetical protein